MLNVRLQSLPEQIHELFELGASEGLRETIATFEALDLKLCRHQEPSQPHTSTSGVHVGCQKHLYRSSAYNVVDDTYDC